MQRFVRILLFSCALLGLAGLLPGPGREAAALQPPAPLLSSYVVDNGPLRLEIAVSPPVSAPGQSLLIELTLTNHGSEAAVPEVAISIPSGLSITRHELPAGTTMNLQTNSLSWQPLLHPHGDERRLEVPARVDVADMTSPERSITAALRYGGQQESVAANFWVGLPPQASITLNPPRPAVGQPVQLIANVNGVGPLSQNWSLGDGRSLDVNNPTVVYGMSGVYEIRLQVSNPLGSAEAVKMITVVPEPAAHFTPEDMSVTINQPVVFLNQSGGQPPLRYAWDFGDGVVSTERQPVHHYTEYGVYQVRLAVENEYGRAENSVSITVGPAPVADMLIDETGRSGEPIFAQAFGDSSVQAFRWEMGDGRRHEGTQISHIYDRAGQYWVTLTAVNQYGQTQISRWVEIQSGLMRLFLPLVLVDLLDSHLLDSDQAETNPLALTDLEPAERLQPLNLPSSMTQAERLFHYINEARRLYNLPPLAYQYELSVAAQSHTQDMANARFTGHTGSDGSTPAVRLARHGYPGGYTGEATAWGMDRAIRVVQFWLDSPSHRPIILNEIATEVGVGYTVDFNAPNVWYWTAEFGSPHLSPVAIEPPAPADPVEEIAPITLVAPAPGAELQLGDDLVTFAWHWPGNLSQGRQFNLYLYERGLPRKVIGVVGHPAPDGNHTLQVRASDVTLYLGGYEWRVQLESDVEGILQESDLRPLRMGAPAATPVPTQPALPTATPTPFPPPPDQPPPPTATPLPVATPAP